MKFNLRKWLGRIAQYAKRPSVWFDGNEYPWSDKEGDYARFFTKGGKGGKPVCETLTEAKAKKAARLRESQKTPNARRGRTKIIGGKFYVCFDRKPSQAEIASLKKNGLKWNPKEQGWLCDSEDAVEFLKDIGFVPKSWEPKPEETPKQEPKSETKTEKQENPKEEPPKAEPATPAYTPEYFAGENKKIGEWADRFFNVSSADIKKTLKELGAPSYDYGYIQSYCVDLRNSLNSDSIPLYEKKSVYNLIQNRVPENARDNVLDALKGVKDYDSLSSELMSRRNTANARAKEPEKEFMFGAIQRFDGFGNDDELKKWIDGVLEEKGVSRASSDLALCPVPLGYYFSGTPGGKNSDGIYRWSRSYASRSLAHIVRMNLGDKIPKEEVSKIVDKARSLGFVINKHTTTPREASFLFSAIYTATLGDAEDFERNGYYYVASFRGTPCASLGKCDSFAAFNKRFDAIFPPERLAEIEQRETLKATPKAESKPASEPEKKEESAPAKEKTKQEEPPKAEPVAKTTPEPEEKPEPAPEPAPEKTEPEKKEEPNPEPEPKKEEPTSAAEEKKEEKPSSPEPKKEDSKRSVQHTIFGEEEDPAKKKSSPKFRKQREKKWSDKHKELTPSFLEPSEQTKKEPEKPSAILDEAARSNVTDIGVAYGVRKINGLVRNIESGTKKFTSADMARTIAPTYANFVNYAGQILNGNSASVAQRAAARSVLATARKIAMTVAKTGTNVKSESGRIKWAPTWQRFLQNGAKNGKATPTILSDFFKALLVPVRKMLTEGSIDDGFGYQERRDPFAESSDPTPSPIAPEASLSPEPQVRSKSKGGRPKSGGISKSDEEFHRSQIDSGVNPDSDDDVGFLNLPADHLRRLLEIRAKNNLLPWPEQRKREIKADREREKIFKETFKEAQSEKNSGEKERDSRVANGNGLEPVQYSAYLGRRGVRLTKPRACVNGRVCVGDDKIGDDVFGFSVNGRRVVQNLSDVAESESAEPFDVAKAYKGLRIWMGDDAQTIQDGKLVVVKPRRRLYETKLECLNDNGFTYDTESGSWVRFGAMSPLDIERFKSFQLIFDNESDDGLNPKNLDQDSYATLRSRGLIDHIPENLRGTVLEKKNVQKHSKEEGPFGFSWETFERDGETCFKAGRAPSDDLREKLLKAGFFYDDVGRIWRIDYLVETNAEILKGLGLRWDEYADEDLTIKYLGLELPKTNWIALAADPSALAQELRDKVVVCNPTRRSASLSDDELVGDDPTMEDSPRWDEAVCGALYDALCPIGSEAYDACEPELIEIPLGDGTYLQYTVFDATAQKPTADERFSYAFRIGDDLAEGQASNLIEELRAIQKGESYQTEDSNGIDAFDDPDAISATTPLPRLEINSFRTNAPNILDVFNKSVFFIDPETLAQLRRPIPY